MPAFRQMSATGTPSAPCFRMNAFWASEKFDAFMVTFSPSHGYHALAALAQSAQKLGLDRYTAFAAASHALADGIISWREGTESLEGLLHESATPGGIAAAVMNAMDQRGYSKTVARALKAGLFRLPLRHEPHRL